jgi:hypothetical protein
MKPGLGLGLSKKRRPTGAGPGPGPGPGPGEPWDAWTEHYYALDPSDADSLYQDTAKTSPVTEDGQAFQAGEVYDSGGALFDTISGVFAGWKWGSPESARAINGRPVLYFDGSQRFSIRRSGDKLLTEYATSDLAFVMHMVIRMRDSANDNTASSGPVSSGGGGGVGSRFHTASGGVIRASGSINGFQTRDVPWADNNAHILTFRLTAEDGDFLIYKDAAHVATIDSSAWGGKTSPISVLGQSHMDVGGWFLHDGLDAEWAAKVADLIDWFGVVPD